MIEIERFRDIPRFDAQAKLPRLEAKIRLLESDKRFLQSRVNELKDQLQDERRWRNK